MDICIFCNKILDCAGPLTTLTAKGCDGIAKASDLRHDCNVLTVPGQRIHTNCRKSYCSDRLIKSANKKRGYDEEQSQAGPTTRLSLGTLFEYRDHCLFCGHPDKYAGKKSPHKLIPIRTLDFQNSIKEACSTRNDSWAETVNGRIEFVSDLPAAGAMYHLVCSTNFRTGRQIPLQFNTDDTNPSKRLKTGRPHDSMKVDAFNEAMDYLITHDDEQTTVHMLIEKMRQNLPPDIEPYSFPHMKASIKSHFGDTVTIAEVHGKANVVTFRHIADIIINDFYAHPKDDNSQDEKLRIIQTAAKLLKSDMKMVSQPQDTYPQASEMSSTDEAISFVPESLCLLLRLLFVGKNTETKVASIGQAILQATRPRVITAPLQLGLGVQLHYHFGSRFLIDTLSEHGFCSSYHEVQKFERSAAVQQGSDVPNFAAGDYIQYMADNVDHNIHTIDGLHTFHGMGVIAAVTPAKRATALVPRISVTAADIAAVGRVNIKTFSSACGIETLKYDPLNYEPHTDFHIEAVDALWDMSLHLRSTRPSWAGTMQSAYDGPHPGPASVLFLPMIDMNPGNLSCIYSTLSYICDHACRYGVTPMVTFDQPLWWKAMTILENESPSSELRKIVLRLGGFHTLMSFLGCIGHIMAGSGLKSLLEQVYASNTVSHMLTGKAYGRAVRGHILVSSALNTMLMSIALDLPLPHMSDTSSSEQEQTLTSQIESVAASLPGQAEKVSGLTLNTSSETAYVKSDLKDAAELYDGLLAGAVPPTEVQDSKALQRLIAKLKETKASLLHYRTARLWLQYIDMVSIMRRFIRSERTANWKLNLQVLQEMLPYMAASGHNLYVKSIYLYLQHMAPLSSDKVFEDGLHVVRRSDRFWAGLSTDLFIEQVLMKSIKSTGGLTRGRGMDETQRLIWLLSSPQCAEINHAMQELTSVSYSTSDQHKDLSKARQERDVSDTRKLIFFLATRSPFVHNTNLICIDSGVCADSDVSADTAKCVGDKIVNRMIGKSVQEFAFKKKDQIVTIDKTSVVRLGSTSVEIDPQLLFQRLITAGTNSDGLEHVFQYELCSYPPALFKNGIFLLEADKAALATALWNLLSNAGQDLPSEVKYVLDGGALLHKLPWKTGPHGQTYSGICQSYVKYVKNKYGQVAIVFDGYTSGPTTKDNTHARRQKSKPGPEVHFTNDMICTLTKDQFLSNSTNKQKFINVLSAEFEHDGHHVSHAQSDADVLIVQTAIQMAQDYDTVVVGDDTDLLVLLCSLAHNANHRLFMRPEQKTNAVKPARCWDIQLLQQSLGENVTDCLLFVHAILGCDTTSRLCGIGKPSALKKAQSSEHFRQQAAVFNSSNATHLEVVAAGEKALVSLYGGKPGQTLDNLRLHTFYQKVSASTTCVHPCCLPPSSAAAKYHSLRVYHQVQQWLGVTLPAEDWGWQIQNDQLLPMTTDLPPAPAYLLEAIRCKCKSGCITNRCGCRKYGLECSPACTECKGIQCSNSTVQVADSDDDYE